LEKDLADVVFTDEYTYGDNLWIPIKEDPFVAVVPSHVLKGKRSVTREELYPYTYISINEKILDSYFDKSRFSNVLNFTSIDNVSVLYMVKEGLGFSVLPSLVTTQRIGGVHMLRLTPPISRTIGFACKKEGKPSYATKIFIEYLTNKNQKHYFFLKMIEY
jgi:DNA-binding transcriptional LysR family regulator